MMELGLICLYINHSSEYIIGTQIFFEINLFALKFWVQ